MNLQSSAQGHSLCRDTNNVSWAQSLTGYGRIAAQRWTKKLGTTKVQLGAERAVGADGAEE